MLDAGKTTTLLHPTHWPKVKWLKKIDIQDGCHMCTNTSMKPYGVSCGSLRSRRSSIQMQIRLIVSCIWIVSWLIPRLSWESIINNRSTLQRSLEPWGLFSMHLVIVLSDGRTIRTPPHCHMRQPAEDGYEKHNCDLGQQWCVMASSDWCVLLAPALPEFLCLYID